MHNSRNLIKAFSFPRASLVASWTLRTLFDFIPVLGATLVFIITIPPHSLPTLEWLFIIPIILIGVVFCAGLTLITSSLTAVVPDMKFIWPLLGRFWFYASGIFFGLERFDSVPSLKSWMEANPAYVVLTISRDVLLYKSVPSMSSWLYLLAWSLLLFTIGFLVFWGGEESYGRIR